MWPCTKDADGMAKSVRLGPDQSQLLENLVPTSFSAAVVARVCLSSSLYGPRGCKTFFTLSSAEHETFPSHKC